MNLHTFMANNALIPASSASSEGFNIQLYIYYLFKMTVSFVLEVLCRLPKHSLDPNPMDQGIGGEAAMEGFKMETFLSI